MSIRIAKALFFLKKADNFVEKFSDSRMDFSNKQAVCARAEEFYNTQKQVEQEYDEVFVTLSKYYIPPNVSYDFIRAVLDEGVDVSQAAAVLEQLLSESFDSMKSEVIQLCERLNKKVDEIFNNIRVRRVLVDTVLDELKKEVEAMEASDSNKKTCKHPTKLEEITDEEILKKYAQMTEEQQGLFKEILIDEDGFECTLQELVDAIEIMTAGNSTKFNVLGETRDEQKSVKPIDTYVNPGDRSEKKNKAMTIDDLDKMAADEQGITVEELCKQDPKPSVEIFDDEEEEPVRKAKLNYRKNMPVRRRSYNSNHSNSKVVSTFNFNDRNVSMPPMQPRPKLHRLTGYDGKLVVFFGGSFKQGEVRFSWCGEWPERIFDIRNFIVQELLHVDEISTNGHVSSADGEAQASDANFNTKPTTLTLFLVVRMKEIDEERIQSLIASIESVLSDEQ